MFFFKQKTAYEVLRSLVGSEMCIRDRKNEVSFMWSSDPESQIPYPSIELNPITYTPPLEDVTYRLRVSTLGSVSYTHLTLPTIYSV